VRELAAAACRTGSAEAMGGEPPPTPHRGYGGMRWKLVRRVARGPVGLSPCGPMRPTDAGPCGPVLMPALCGPMMRPHVVNPMRHATPHATHLTQIRRWTQTQAPSAPRAAIRCFFSSFRQVLSGDAELSTKEMASLQSLQRSPLRCQSRSRNELSEFAWGIRRPQVLCFVSKISCHYHRHSFFAPPAVASFSFSPHPKGT
jgi:hypothetical protein